MRIGTTLAAVAAAGLWLSGCAGVPKAGGGRVGPPFAGIHTTDEVIALIEKSEGLKLQAYAGAGGQWLIGYGHAAGVKRGQKITRKQADSLLRQDVRKVEDEVKGMVRVPIDAHELSALVDLAYNIGSGAFRESSVLRELNAGNRRAAADAFLAWDKITVNGRRVSSPALADRRRTERSIFLGSSRPAAAEAGA